MSLDCQVFGQSTDVYELRKPEVADLSYAFPTFSSQRSKLLQTFPGSKNNRPRTHFQSPDLGRRPPHSFWKDRQIGKPTWLEVTLPDLKLTRSSCLVFNFLPLPSVTRSAAMQEGSGNVIGSPSALGRKSRPPLQTL